MGVLTGAGLGKLLLFGEHAAVYGHPAVGISLPMETSVTYRKGVRMSFSGIDKSDRETIASLFQFVREQFPGYSEILEGSWSITSSIPRKAGFGSSAALCSAVAEVLGKSSANNGPVREDIWYVANSLEKHFHGTPSGIDTGLAIMGGMRGFYPHPPNLPKQIQLTGSSLRMVIGSTKRMGNTRELISGIRSRLESGDEVTKRSLKELGDIAKESLSVLPANPVNYELLGSLIHEADRILGLLGLNHPLTRQCIDSEVERNAIGGKTSGAGNGGAFFIVYKTNRDAVDGFHRIEKSVPELTYLSVMEWIDEKPVIISKSINKSGCSCP